MNGDLLEGRQLAQLRWETACVDPSVQLWNRPFIDNLTYGADSQSQMPIGSAIEEADLHGVLQKLPDGFQRSEFLLEKGMIDLVVDRREMKPIIASALRFMGAARAASSAVAAVEVPVPLGTQV